jgi:hypothetical protein
LEILDYEWCCLVCICGEYLFIALIELAAIYFIEKKECAEKSAFSVKWSTECGGNAKSRDVILAYTRIATCIAD